MTARLVPAPAGGKHGQPVIPVCSLPSGFVKPHSSELGPVYLAPDANPKADGTPAGGRNHPAGAVSRHQRVDSRSGADRVAPR
jgi:hypothetical protein